MKKRLALFLMGILLFITAIEGIKTSWGMMGGGVQEHIISMIGAGTIGIVGLAIGLLATSLVQSSSAVVAATMASIAGMVASGMPPSSAISFGVPLVLGANIGTTVTNSMVAIGHSKDEEKFDSVVPGAIVHDIFNILNVTFFFALEMTTGLLSKIAVWMSHSIIGFLDFQSGSFASMGLLDFLIERPLIVPVSRFLTYSLGNFFGGLSLLLGSFGCIVFALSLISKNVKYLVNTTSLKERVFKALKSPFKSVLAGTSVTWTLQSSSVATSLALPFLAVKAIDLEQMYAYSLGCNIGTTIDLSQIYGYMASGIAGVSLGLTHVMVNTFGVALWLFTPLKKIPPFIAQQVGNRITSSRAAPLFLLSYVAIIFFAAPLSVIFLL